MISSIVTFSFILFCIFSLALLEGCGKTAEAINKETTKATETETEATAAKAEQDNSEERIFRDTKHSFASDIPDEVLNLNAEVLEVRNGSLLVSFISAPDLFMPPVTGQCEVRTNPEILRDEIAVGDTVRVWFDGLVQEIYPPILPNVYRIVKEK